MRRKVLHIISQAHLDPVWLWPWRDGCAEALTTMQSALDRMQETSGFCFSQSAAATYRWAQEMDGRLFEEVHRRVGEGRWEVVNGWVVEPDCNIPSTESFVRQCLYGKRYFARQLGVNVRVGYNVDSFGHGDGLPQILARAGYRYYVMMRPQAHELDLPMLFWWESPDGSRVLTWRIPTSYGQSFEATAGDLEESIRAAVDRCFPPGFDHGAFFLGVGNHGGGPTRSHLQRVVALQRDRSLPELRFSTLADFFSEIEKSPAFKDVPVVRRELQHHARGCYSAMGEIKAINRRAERGLVKAETLAAVLDMDRRGDNAKEALGEAWWKLLFNQFHDVLAGSCVRSSYRDARDSLGAVCEAADSVAVRSLHSLARGVDTSGSPGGVLFMMNHLPWKRTAVVQFDTFVSPNGDEPITHLRARDGASVPVQWTASEFSPLVWQWKRLTAAVELPPCGYRVFHLAGGDAPDPGGDKAPACHVEDNHLGVASLLAEDRTELLSAPLGLVVVEDAGDTWAHGVDAFRKVVGRPAVEATQVLEDGPVVRVVRQKGRWRGSLIVLDVVTWRHTDAVELRLHVNWQEPRQILKLEVPTALQNVRTFTRTLGSVTERAPDGGEEPGQDWLAVEGRIDGKTYALGVVNDSTYGYDCLDGLLRLTCVRSAPYAEHDPVKRPADYEGPYLDQGWQERRFWLVPGKGVYTGLNLHRRAEELQAPAEHVMDSAHPGTRPWEGSFLSIEPENVSVLAVKRAEDGKGIIVRLQEMQGQRTIARIALPALGLDASSPIGPWEIRSFRVLEANGRLRVREVDLLERARGSARHGANNPLARPGVAHQRRVRKAR
jgi:alpha-mannosidase